MLGYSRQALYKKTNSRVEQLIEAELVLQEVQKIRSKHRRVGTKKLHRMLQPFLEEHSIKIGRDGLFDLLREFGMLVKPLRRNHYSTDSYHRFYKYPNLIKQWQPSAPNQLWVSDITYIEVNRAFMYLSVITDAWSRKIVGWHLSDDYSVQGPVKALKMALADNKNIKDIVHHSDRGVQYCSKEYVAILKNRDVKISMTENGDPYENALAERVNGIIKGEYMEKYYRDNQTANRDVRNGIGLYNKERLHLSIGMMTPEHVHQTAVAAKNLWKKQQSGNSINSKGNNTHKKVNAISP